MNPIVSEKKQMCLSNSEAMSQLALLHEQRENCANELLRNIRERLPQLEALLANVEEHWGIEDGFYRFYHQSFKVYHLQHTTEEICKALKDLSADRSMNKWFAEIVAQGTGQQFEMSHNQEWLRHTRPIIEAFFHAYFFLKMVVKYGNELENASNCLPSGWAAVLYLFDLR